MAKGQDPRDGGYAVGYGRPPKATQFAPGKSGNPRGRPKGSRSVAATLIDVLSRKVTLAEHGKTRRVPALEGILHRALDDGLRGDKGAMKLVLALAERYGESSEKTLNLDEMQAEDRAILARYAIPNASPSDLEANASPGQALDEEGGDDADPV